MVINSYSFLHLFTPFVCNLSTKICFACDAIFGSSGADLPLPVGLLESLFILSQRSVDSACVPLTF